MNILKTTIKELIKTRVKTPADLASFKRRMAKKYKITFPSNVELLRAYHKLIKNKILKKEIKIENLLRKRPIRSLSGIVNVSVLTKPYPCPGKCIYCPNQRGVPKSYLNNEPAVMRAILNKYDPYRQVQMRLRALQNTGHPTDKIELRIIGGTWSYYPKRYQTWFITRCFDGCNGGRASVRRRGLRNVQRLNEKTKHRIVGLSIETRPDFITESEIKRLRKLGVTMVELGVQTIYDDVLKLNKRGHGVKETIKATKLLKDSGFKVLYQMMPNLPGSDLKRDKNMFRILYSDSNFQPDLLKIYPCVLLRTAPLYKWWKEKKYKPHTYARLINLVKSIKKEIPYYVRIQRIARDIPSQSIIAGPGKISNLRQIIAQDSIKEDWKCRCIRCREVKERYNAKEKLYLFREDYNASGGKEIFLSFENKNRRKLYSLLRLRIPSSIFQQFKKRSRAIFPILENAAIIREVHTYGQQLPLLKNRRRTVPPLSPQHKGLGKKLIKIAERIVHTEFNRSAKKEVELKKIIVISGVGTRGYFRELGYKLKDEYMVKSL